MLNILYTQVPDGEVLIYQTYPNAFDKKNATNWILDQGYELVGES